jgi:DNA-binding NtrC family response regulator
MQQRHRNSFHAPCSKRPVETGGPTTLSAFHRRPEPIADDRHSLFPRHEGVPAWVGRRLADVERELILDTLRFCFGNRTRAAKMLGVSIRTMRNRLKSFAAEGLNIPTPDLRQGP